MPCKMQNSEWTHSFRVYRRAEQLCHFLIRNMSGSVFIPESTMLRVVAAMCQVLEAHEMPYRTPELLLRLQMDETERSPGKSRKNRVFRFCRKHADNPSDPELYELYRTAEVLTAAFDCGKLLCCDAEQLLPWSTPMVLDLIRTAASILQAQGYPAEIPADLAETKPVNAQ